MNEPDSHAAPGTFRVGDRVRIHPDWQDPGDDDFVRVVIQAPPDSPCVLIATLIPGFAHPPTEWIDVEKLLPRTDGRQYKASVLGMGRAPRRVGGYNSAKSVFLPSWAPFSPGKLNDSPDCEIHWERPIAAINREPHNSPHFSPKWRISSYFLLRLYRHHPNKPAVAPIAATTYSHCLPRIALSPDLGLGSDDVSRAELGSSGSESVWRPTPLSAGTSTPSMSNSLPC